MKIISDGSRDTPQYRDYQQRKADVWQRAGQLVASLKGIDLASDRQGWYDALRQLVELHQQKEAFGKNAEYEAAKTQAWRIAAALVASSDNEQRAGDSRPPLQT